MKVLLRLSVVCCTLTVIGLMLAGCGSKSAQSVATERSKVFQSAPAEVKTDWDAAMSAVKTSDYATAVLTLRKLAMQTNLTQEQIDAVSKTSVAVSDQMYAAANKGDPKAEEALQTLRKAMGR
ncbi:MAG TPA: hypothetical protein VEC99_05575 [Clostridia bacterium]|nr:hypothetical protein [Clostridia bacterium]